MAFRFSIRSLFAATLVVACLVYLLIEFGNVRKASGGGQQTIFLTSVPASVIAIECIPVRNIEQASSVVAALSSGNRIDLYRQVDPTMISSHLNIGDNLDLKIEQSWSSVDVGRTRRRYRYGQRYSHVVINLRRVGQEPMQVVIDLPEYCREVRVDHFAEPQQSVTTSTRSLSECDRS